MVRLISIIWKAFGYLLGLLGSAGVLSGFVLAWVFWSDSTEGLFTSSLVILAFNGVGFLALRKSFALLRPINPTTTDFNARVLLLGLTTALLVVGTCLLIYPPGSAIYDQTPDGRIHAVVGYESVPLVRTLLHIAGVTGALAVPPTLLWLLARHRQQVMGRPVNITWLLWLIWLLLVAGWLFLSDWYPAANVD